MSEDRLFWILIGCMMAAILLIVWVVGSFMEKQSAKFKKRAKLTLGFMLMLDVMFVLFQLLGDSCDGSGGGLIDWMMQVGF